MSAMAFPLEVILGVAVAIVCAYAVRQYLFTFNRLFGRQRHPFLDVRTAAWPTVTVLIPAHNEEAVIGGALTALLAVDYPADRLTIVPIEDRSTDGTAALVDAFAERYPGRVVPLHRPHGGQGKAAALAEATELTTGEIIIVFDADYLPSTGLLKRLVAPFFDPEVGAVMGRVVPHNAGRNLLTRLLDLERAGGYQVDQQARMNLSLVPQYGGTVGGVRRAALQQVGGWRTDTLTEDTDLTIRLIVEGWQIVYENRAECYEEVPETWPARARQIDRWARGHNEVMRRWAWNLLRSALPLRQRIDGLLLLGVYLLAPLMVFAWFATLVLFYMGRTSALPVAAVLAVASYATMGNFAAFFEIAAAVRLDGNRQRVRLLPFLGIGFFVSLVTVSLAAIPKFGRRGDAATPPRWNKTPRSRVAESSEALA
jgi:cellulose synthase/poly-beta-1,6-N-acetylglucosamine synthase-like glycosyltransferase